MIEKINDQNQHKTVSVWYDIHKLYTMTRIDNHTGNRTIRYGHATMNVILEFLQYNVDGGFTVEIMEYNPER